MVQPVLLVVEDEPSDQQLLVLALEEAGVTARMHFCDDGEALTAYLAAVAEGLEPPPAVVLMDLRLPGRPGWELVAEIRKDPVHRLVPVIVHSSSRLAADVQRSYDAGANAFVAKPLDFDELVELLVDLDRFWLGRCLLPGPPE